jgi:endonuclease/exonuclease/phosphatase (EEP) superfamily protein YafD
MKHSGPGPRAGIVAERLVRWFGWCSLGLLLVIWLSIALLGDRLWWTVALLFGPRWIMALPWFGVVPWLLADFRRAVLPALVGLAIACFGIVTFHLGLHRAAATPGVPFRVLELNAEGGGGVGREAKIVAEIGAAKPDLVIVAECGVELSKLLRTEAGYNVRNTDFRGLCLLSRGDLLDWQQRDQKDVFVQGGAGYIVRAVVSTPAGPIRVGMVHLATPRRALDSYFDLSELPKQGPNTKANMAQRDEESQLARSWIMSGAPLPIIVAGDFNLTVESAIYRRYWGDLRNAFGRAGWGTGYTKYTRHWGARIDHVLTSDNIGTRSSFVGPDVGSDHRPLIADLILPAPH